MRCLCAGNKNYKLRKAEAMSNIYKIATTLVLFTLASAAISILISYESGWQIGLIFLLPILWTLWIACVIFHKMETQTWKLILLWVLIDLAVLLTNRLMLGSFHGFDPTVESVFVLLMEFSPTILPMIPISLLPVIGTGLTAIADGASYVLLPIGSVGVLRDWLELSILSAIPSYIFASLWFYLKSMRMRKLGNESENI
jgi:hypothetical protein